MHPTKKIGNCSSCGYFAIVDLICQTCLEQFQSFQIKSFATKRTLKVNCRLLCFKLCLCHLHSVCVWWSESKCSGIPPAQINDKQITAGKKTFRQIISEKQTVVKRCKSEIVVFDFRICKLRPNLIDCKKHKFDLTNLWSILVVKLWVVCLRKSFWSEMIVYGDWWQCTGDPFTHPSFRH